MNILTFDIEEWFHIKFDEEFFDDTYFDSFEKRLEKNMHFILDLLDNNHQKATFFCLGWVARKYPSVVIEIDKRGHEIGSHSDMHKLLFSLNRQEFKEDLNNSISSIESLINKKVKYYRAPSFSITNKNSWVFEELINFGIEIDCSIFPAKRSNGGFKNFISNKPSIIKTNDNKEIKEFPINTIKILNKNIIFSGGGYFRLLPYNMLRRFMRNSNYVMTYFHPRDFDPKQPILNNLSPIQYFKSYIGLRGSRKKIESLLSEFNFLSLGEANKLIDWSKSPIHNL